MSILSFSCSKFANSWERQGEGKKPPCLHTSNLGSDPGPQKNIPAVSTTQEHVGSHRPVLPPFQVWSSQAPLCRAP